MQSQTILLSGFEAFGEHLVNPSIELARALDGESIGGLRVVAQELPCEFACAGAVLTSAVDRVSPRLVLAMGLAAGRADLAFERIAINLIDARIADNAGAQPIEEPICSDGPAAFFSTLPIRRMVAAARRAGVAASISSTAGTFVCNQVFYQLQRHLERAQPAVPSGFLHLPLRADQVAQRLGRGAAVAPALCFTDMLTGLRAALLEAVCPGALTDRAALSSEGSLS